MKVLKQYSRQGVSIIGALAVALGLMLASAPAQAEGFELTPLVGYRIGGEFEIEDSGEELELDDAAMYGFIFGFPLDYQSVVEVELAYQGTTLQGAGPFSGEDLFDLGVWTLQAGGRYQSDHDKVKGFVSGGVGLSLFSPKEDFDGQKLDDEWAWVLSLGGGAIIPVSEKLAIRVEGRGVGTFLINSSGAFCSQGICAIAIEGSGFLQLELRAGLAINF
jgi:opacity protein-like surface antigen